MSKKKAAQAPAIKPRPLGLGRPAWIFLTLIDLFLFVVGALSGRIDLSLGALALIFIIEHYAHDLLVAPYERRQERLRAQYGIKGQITPEQSREAIKEFRRERQERKAQRKALKKRAHAATRPGDGAAEQ